MKFVLTFIILTLSTSVCALEIECETNMEDLAVVIHASENNDEAYLLPVQSTIPLTPMYLSREYLSISDQALSYYSAHLSIELDRVEMIGQLTVDFKNILLDRCVEYRP